MLEASDPGLVSEILKKKKWHHVQKDPARAQKDLSHVVTNYW
jgi:hypothetical protein